MLYIITLKAGPNILFSKFSCSCEHFSASVLILYSYIFLTIKFLFVIKIFLLFYIRECFDNRHVCVARACLVPAQYRRECCVSWKGRYM